MKMLNWLYNIFLMPYFERDKYFAELCDEAEVECNRIASNIVSETKEYTVEDLKDAYTFAFAEGIVFGMNTNYNHKEFKEWLKEKKQK